VSQADAPIVFTEGWRRSEGADENVHSRTLPRHRLEMPTTFTWTDERGLRQSAKGVTRDISAGGVFVEADTPPPVGLPVRLEIVLPPLRKDVPGIRLLTESRVLRVQPAADERPGFAAVNEQFVLEALQA